MVFLACMALFLALSLFPGISLLSSWSASFLALTVCNSSLFTPASSRTHSFVFFAVHETRRIFLEGPIKPCFRCMGPGSLEETGTDPGMLELCLQVVPRYRQNGVRSSINQLDSCVQQQTLADGACPSVRPSVCLSVTPPLTTNN